MTQELKDWLGKNIPSIVKSPDKLSGQEVREIFQKINYAPIDVQIELLGCIDFKVDAVG